MSPQDCPHGPEAQVEAFWMQVAPRPVPVARVLSSEDMVRQALADGIELAVLLREVPETRLRGHVHAADEEGFSLYHSGVREGYLWHLPWGRVAAVAFVVPRPDWEAQVGQGDEVA